MGQKVNPIGLRVGVINTWESKWYSDKKYSQYIIEDFNIRKMLKSKLQSAGVSKIEIERPPKQVRLKIHTAKPGIVIGKRGADIEKLKKELQINLGHEVSIEVQEVSRPDVDAQLVSENVALQIVKRVTFRKAMKRGVTSAMKAGAKGIKIICSGRLGGAEMARTEWYREGRVPLHTLRADINYGFAEARTTYGIIGIKVFIFKGEILKKNLFDVSK